MRRNCFIDVVPSRIGTGAEGIEEDGLTLEKTEEGPVPQLKS